MAGENRIGIEFGQTGAEGVVAATQQTGAAVRKANEDAAKAVKASGDDQVRTHTAVGQANKTAATTAKANAQAQQQAAATTSGAMKQMMGMADRKSVV